MAETTIAHPTRTTRPIPDETRSRVLRGLKLYLERGDETERAPEPATFYVPGCSGGRYEVSLGVGEDAPSCTCPDFEQRQAPCKHCYCLVIWTAHRNVQRCAEREKDPRRRRRPAPDLDAIPAAA